MHACFSALNDGLQHWFNGTIDNTDRVFEELIASTHDQLSYVFPEGSSATGSAVWEPIRRGWGTNPELRIVTPRRYTRVLLEQGGCVIAEIIELQDGARAVEPPRHARRTTLVFLNRPEAPFGLTLWRLHESLLGEAEQLDWSELA